MANPIQKENIPRLVPDSQFPEQALQESVQKFPEATQGGSLLGGNVYTWNLASSADMITKWGVNTPKRDIELREFWPTEPYVAGALVNVSMRNAASDWEIRGPEKVAQAVTDMLLRAIAGPEIGWTPFEMRGSQDLYAQDNGRFEELIRDPGADANSKFKDERAPVIGIAHLDAGQCQRTGNPEWPVIYTDRKGGLHKLAWYQVICFSEFPSPIERMNGVGVCAVSRALRLAQIMKNIELFKDEKIGGRHYKQMHFVSGVGRTEIKDEMKRGQEEANNAGAMRFVMPAILASLDPEKPVSVATIDLASLPDNFNFDEEMRWYISGLALSFGVDYQEFAPLPGGNIGSSNQSQILHKKSSGKGPATYMRRKVEAYKVYGVMPRTCEMVYNDKNEQEELEKQSVRTKAAEEYAINARNGVLTPDAIRADMVKRGIYDATIVEMVPEGYGDDIIAPNKNNVGQIGGNTMVEDNKRQETGKPNETGGGRLRKMAARLQPWKR